MTMATTQDAPATSSKLGGFFSRLGNLAEDAGRAVIDYRLNDQPGTNEAHTPATAPGGQAGPVAASMFGNISPVMLAAGGIGILVAILLIKD